MRRILVVGAGVAGTAAALTAARAGAHVTVVAAGPGASTLAGGAIDQEPWEARAPALELDAAERFVLDAMGGFRVPPRGREILLAALTGILRTARGADAGLLDLSDLEDAEVAVPRVEWQSWDAVALARAFGDSPLARERRLRFSAVPAQLVRHHAEHDLSDADMAALHDAPDRLEWTAARLAGMRGAGAVLLPAWLGLEHERATDLSARLGIPCGEAMVSPGGPSGLRFERARDRALSAAGVVRIDGRVSVLTCAGSWSARLEAPDTEVAEPVPTLVADAVVLAAGGLIGGGLAYGPIASLLAADARPAPGPLVRAALDAPVVVGYRGAPLSAPSSLFGAAPEAHAWPCSDRSLTEQAGVLVDADGRVRGGRPGLFAAGDFVADRPRTWLEALGGGVRAGRAASTSPLIAV